MSVGEFVTSFFKKTKESGPSMACLGLPVRMLHGPFQFQVRLLKGTAYEVQVSTNLVTWVGIAKETAPENTFDYVDSDASKFGFRCYRVIANGVVSDVVLGFATVTLPPGFSMIANPLNGANNSVAGLFPKMSDGTMLHKFDTLMFRLNENEVKFGKWTNPSETLVPGEGALFYNPTTDFKTINFVGEVMQGHLMNPIPAGFSIRSSLIPQPGRLHADLGFPISDGDVVHLFDKDSQKYLVFTYDRESWEKNSPTIAVGESFWVGKTSPDNWVRNFSMSQV